jgi:hypothetical protein
MIERAFGSSGNSAGLEIAMRAVMIVGPMLLPPLMMCCVAASAKDLRVVTCGATGAVPSGVEIVRLHGRACGPKEARVTVNVHGSTIDRVGPSGGLRVTSIKLTVK